MKPTSFNYADYEAMRKDRDQWRLAAESARDGVQPMLRKQIERLTADVEGWKQNFTTERNNRIAVTAERDAAVECIGVAEDRLSRISQATDYVKLNTGLWHTVHIALDEIKKWRGTKGAE